jgi:hypothetical protein
MKNQEDILQADVKVPGDEMLLVEEGKGEGGGRKRKYKYGKKGKRKK